MMMMIIIIIIIIITLKGAIHEFYNLLTARQTVSMYTQVATVQSCANHMQQSRAYHMQHVKLPATWCEGPAQLLSLTELKWHLF